MLETAWLEIADGKVSQGINLFLQRLMQERIVDALLVLTHLNTKNGVAPVLATEPEILTRACPLAPVVPVSLARVVSSLTRVASSQRRIGVVLRPCELRALVELVKLKQASLENLLLIGLDCFGTYAPVDYQKSPTISTEEFLRRAQNGDESNLREACRVCEHFTPWNADLTIGLFGVDLERHVLLQAMTEKGAGILKSLRLPDGAAEAREKAIAELKTKRLQQRETLHERGRREIAGLENLLSLFAACNNCHNCRVACPICYCKECFLESPTFELEAEKYLALAEKKGALRMPADTLLFHLTRITHVGVSCVGCGLCQDACPEGVPLFPLFCSVGDEVQKLFNYIPGRSLEEEPPLTKFDEDELSWVS